VSALRAKSKSAIVEIFKGATTDDVNFYNNMEAV
jgi:hypothetical protein